MDLFFIIFALCWGKIWGEWVTWSHLHQECVLNFDRATNTQSHQCHDSPYYAYFQQLLNTSPSELQKKNPHWEYYQQVAKAVVELYDDMAKNKVPMPIYIHANQAHSSPSLPTTPINNSYAHVPYHENIRYVHPVSFGIPEDMIIKTLSSKRKPFAQVIPGITSTYFHLFNESSYYEDMKQSLFALTYKKGGWDCLRHYEILAMGCLPLFLDIAQSPSHALSLHPKRLYQLLLQYPGLVIEAVRDSRMTYRIHSLQFPPWDKILATSPSSTPPIAPMFVMDTTFYSAISLAMLQYMRNVLSTKALAQYVLDTIAAYSHGKVPSFSIPRKILYLTHEDHDMDKGDYLTDLMLHGLYELFGSVGGGGHQVVVDFPSRDALFKSTTNLFGMHEYYASRKQLYGQGFSWGHKINTLAWSDAQKTQDRLTIAEQIRNHSFDVIILGSGHRDGWASKLSFWSDLLCPSDASLRPYHPLELAIIEGADHHMKQKVIQKYAPCVGHFFSREGYNAHHAK